MARIPPGKLHRLLTALLSRAGDGVAVEELIDVAWPAKPPSTALKTLRCDIHRLRDALPEPMRIVTRPLGYTLQLRPGELDADQFTDLLRRAEKAHATGELTTAVGFYDQALALWRGRPYEGLEDCLFLAPARVALDGRRFRALEGRAEVRLALGQHAELMPELSLLTTESPCEERLASQLMLALYRSGRSVEALEVYQRIRSSLRQEYGVEPGPALRHLQQAVLRNDSSLALTTERVVSSMPVPAQLPPDLHTLTGRQAELDQLLMLAAEGDGSRTPVVGLIDGMAGVGKTAIAVHAAHLLAGEYADGQLFLDLHGFTPNVPAIEPSAALARLLRSIGVPGDQIPQGLEDRATLWRTCLADKRFLIVLDNVASEEQVRPLLPPAPGCLVLVTSRHRLAGIAGADGLSLGVLSPLDAKRLFAGLAEAGSGTAEPSALVDQAVELCGLLPLAIRLVAGRVRHRPPGALAALVERLKGRQNRLAELTISQRSVSVAFELSYQRLDVEHQRMFRLLGLLPVTDVDRYAAAALMGVPPQVAERLLEDLVDAHLLEARAGGRYTFHDLLRCHATETANRDEPLPERQAALTRLLDYAVCAVATAMAAYAPTEWLGRPVPSSHSAVPPLSGYVRAVDWLDAERANLIALAGLAAVGEWPEYAVRLSLFLHRYLSRARHNTEAVGLHRNAIHAATVSSDVAGRAIALGNLGLTYTELGEDGEGMACLRWALDLMPPDVDRVHRAVVLNDLGNALCRAGEFQEAYGFSRKSLALFRASGDLFGMARALNSLCCCALGLGREAEAEACARQALELSRGTDDPDSEGYAHNLLGAVQCMADQAAEGLDNFQAGLELCRRAGHRTGQGFALQGMSMALQGLGRFAESVELCQQALTFAEENNDPAGVMQARLRMEDLLELLERSRT